MERKRQNCHAILKAKFSKHLPKQTQIYELPVEHSRKIMKDRSNMKDKKFLKEQTAYLQALKYMPQAIMKLWENMPMPWENEKKVKTIYHVNGALTMVNEINKVAPPVFMAQWGCMWVAMRREKRDRKHFKRLRFPCFDDEEPIIDYSENILDVDPLDPVQLELDEEDDCVADWLYDPPHQKSFHFDTETLNTLYRLASPLTVDIYDPNYYYLFNNKSFFTAKALNIAVPSGPKFEPLYPELKKEEMNEDWNEFNDLKRVLIRLPIRQEYKIAFPHLYNQIPKSVHIDAYHYPANLFNNENTDSEFVFDPSFNPISTRDLEDPFSSQHSQYESTEVEDLKFDQPFFSDFECVNNFALYHASSQFSHSGRTIRHQDVPIIKNWYLQRCPPNQAVKTRVSYQKLLKNHVKNALKKKSHGIAKIKSLPKALVQTKYFHQTSMDWVEAGLQLLQQGHNMLNILITRKELQYLHLDYNFNLKPVKSMSTKERKRSRFGVAFHMIRELLKLTKLVVDAHVQFRLNNCDAFQLADALHYIFNHVGHLTGLYRYKYKSMHQIRQCKDLKHVIYHRFNNLIGKGPGCGFWYPSYKVWLSFMRGSTPLLERWLGNILSRHFEGRQNSKNALQLGKQRIEAQYDLELRASLMHDLVDMMPPTIKAQKTKIILQHCSEAWRCWKANIEWNVPNMPLPITQVVKKYIKMKSDWWIQQTMQIRHKLMKSSVDKSVFKKNLGRLTRLYLINAQNTQKDYLENGPYLEIKEATACFELMVNYLDKINFSPISFPPMHYKNDSKLLLLALDKLNQQYSVKSRLNQAQRQEMGLLEEMYDHPNEALTRIKRLLLTQRSFKPLTIDLMDHIDYCQDVIQVDPLEKITDAYLDQYLWYEADKRQLFPQFIHPLDSTPYPVMAHQSAQTIMDLCNSNDCCVLLSSKLKWYHLLDLNLLNKLLRLIMDPSLADYITSKYNSTLVYKDMTLTNSVGILRGFQFSSFVMQYYGLMVDLMLLPMEYILEYMNQTGINQSNHSILFYARFVDEIKILYKMTPNDLHHNYPIHDPLYNTFNTIKTYPKDKRMRLLMTDVLYAKIAFFYTKSKLSSHICSMDWSSTICGTTSTNNPFLVYEMCGFDICLDLKNKKSLFQVSTESMAAFKNKMRSILMSSGGTTFLKVVQKWNTALLGFVVYFREAILTTPDLLQLLIKSESQVQNRIKMGLNSKMPNRFPPLIFYTPKELGGLGMLSIGHVLIPSTDLRYSKQTDQGITHFQNGLSDQQIPNIFQYIHPWESELQDSIQVWQEYQVLKSNSQGRIQLTDIQHLMDRGIPRINTLFIKDRHVLALDRGWRCKLYFKKYHVLRNDAFFWTDTKLDGKTWQLTSYKTDMIEALGGVECILSHTLFKCTGYTNYEGLFWEKSTEYESAMLGKKLTNAQRSGMNQLPNRRFTLWWSPTINRSQVYIGFLVQLDLTGVLMTGKLPNLKTSYIQLFRGHLWQKIHESLVMDICQSLDMQIEPLRIEKVVKEKGHPRKSYKLNASCADIVLAGVEEWECTIPCYYHQMTTNDTKSTNIKSNVVFIDVQLRWGNVDQHDTDRYCRMKYLEYIETMYPSLTGIVVCIDLCYSTFSIYGNFFPGLQSLMTTILNKLITHNPALFVLKERVKSALQLHNTSSTEQHLNQTTFQDLFNTNSWLIDDSNVYRVTIHKSSKGLSTKPINGALLVMNINTGQIYLHCFHYSEWMNQQRIGQLSKWKAAEVIAQLLQSLPISEHPKQLIVTRKGMMDALQVHLLDYPNLIIKGSELQLPMHTLLKIPFVGDLVLSMTKSQLILINGYGEWLQNHSSMTCFSRLILLLRSFHVDYIATEQLIQLPKDGLWPVYTPEDWIPIEVNCKNIIVDEYCKKNAIPLASLTEQDIRNVILGSEMQAPSLERQQLVANEQVEVNTVKTKNKDGQDMVVVTQSKYNQQEFISQTNWRQRLLVEMQSHYKIVGISVADVDSVQICKKLIQSFLKLDSIAYLLSNGSLINGLATHVVEGYCGVIVDSMDAIGDELTLVIEKESGLVKVKAYRNKEQLSVELVNGSCYTMVPEDGEWIGHSGAVKMRIGRILSKWDMKHRKQHFNEFEAIEESVDMEDYFE